MTRLCRRGEHDLDDPANRFPKAPGCRSCKIGAGARRIDGMCRAGTHPLNGAKRCRECKADYQRQQRAAMTDEERRRAYDWNNEWAKRNPEKRYASNRRWVQSNPESKRATAHRRRVRTTGAGQVSAADIRYVLERDPLCTYCGFCPSTTIDHVIPLDADGPNTFDNIVGACAGCNQSKGNRSFADWRGRECPGCGMATGMLLEEGAA